MRWWGSRWWIARPDRQSSGASFREASVRVHVTLILTSQPLQAIYASVKFKTVWVRMMFEVLPDLQLVQLDQCRTWHGCIGYLESAASFEEEGYGSSICPHISDVAVCPRLTNAARCAQHRI